MKFFVPFNFFLSLFFVFYFFVVGVYESNENKLPGKGIWRIEERNGKRDLAAENSFSGDGFQGMTQGNQPEGVEDFFQSTVHDGVRRTFFARQLSLGATHNLQ